jgi:hypothetical protein
MAAWFYALVNLVKLLRQHIELINNVAELYERSHSVLGLLTAIVETGNKNLEFIKCKFLNYDRSLPPPFARAHHRLVKRRAPTRPPPPLFFKRYR